MAEKMKNAAPAQGGNAAGQLTVDDGSRRFEIKNLRGEVVGEFSLTPSDLGIYERYAQMQDEVNDIVAPMEGVGEQSDIMQLGGALEQTRERLYAAIDRMFGRKGAAQKLFGPLHPLTPVDGRFYFDRVLEAVGNQINDTFREELEKFNANVEKYTGVVER